MSGVVAGETAGFGSDCVMISTKTVCIEKIGYALGKGESLEELALKAASELGTNFTGVIAATFSNERRFPALSIKIASELGLAKNIPAFDLQLACSAYPYAVYLAGKLAEDTEGKILLIDGDVQSRLVDPLDHATGTIFSDACTASVISVADRRKSVFDFYSSYDTALSCSDLGPIQMDGMQVFSFVATEVSKFLKRFGTDFDRFVPHQANPYMIRQLAKSLTLEDRLVTLDEKLKNPGSASVPLTLAMNDVHGRVLIAGFGAGYSASAGIIEI